MAIRWLAALSLLLATGPLARGYAVGPPMPLDELAAKSDLIFQGTAISNTTVSDPSFQSIMGYIVQETDFEPVYATKGKIDSPIIAFRHYAPDPHPTGIAYSPQNYTFETGKTYIVFAKHSAGFPANVCEQIWQSPIGMDDEGVLLAYSSEPLSEHSIKELYWRDLTELLKSTEPKEVVYAITHLDQFSGSSGPMAHFDSLSEFQHVDVLAAVHDFINRPEPEVAQAALLVIGSHNPYMSRDSAPSWLASVGSADTPGFIKTHAKIVNSGGMIYWREIAAVVDGKGDETTRALAVTALGLVREPSLQGSVERWLADPSAKVRSSALLLLADYPALTTHDRLASMAGDPDVEKRISAAYAIGFSQLAEDTDVLTKLLADPDAKVRQAAAMSLLSFSPKDPAVAKIFHDNLTNKEFAVLFLVALCQGDPAGNLDLLIKETSEKTDPTNWPGGQIPAYTTSHLLYKYLVAQPAADLQQGRYNSALDALEIWKPNYSVDPQSIYALELRDGLTDRARKFRAAADKVSPYDLEIYFKQVDANPASYSYN